MTAELQNQSKELQKQEVIDVEVKIDPEGWLTKAEKAALAKFKEYYQKGGIETKDLSPLAAAKLYNLFLEGCTLTEIADLNPELGLGTIVSSAVSDRWDIRRQEYREELYDRAKQNALQIVAEGANFMTTVLVAAHKKHGDKLRKYIQTEDPQYLVNTINIESLRGYKEAVEVFMRLTGQDQIKRVLVDGNVTHTDAPPKEPPKPELSPVALATDITQLAALKRDRKEVK